MGRKSVPSNIKVSDISKIYKKSQERKNGGYGKDFKDVSDLVGKSDPNSDVYAWKSGLTPDQKSEQEILDERFFSASKIVSGVKPRVRPASYQQKIPQKKKTATRPVVRRAQKNTEYVERAPAARAAYKPIECKVNANEFLTKLDVEQRLGGTIYAYQVLLIASGEALTGYVGNGLFRTSDLGSNPHIMSDLQGYKLKDSTKDILDHTKDGRYAAGLMMTSEYGKAHMSQLRKAIETANKERSAKDSL